jgi:SulP family sulfate permease
MGMTTAVWAGFMSAGLGGSQFNIHGPTGALSGIVSKLAAENGGPDVLPFLAVLSGLLLLAMLLLRLDTYCLFIPAAVMNGFTIGVAFIIAFGQVAYAFGLPGAPIIPRHPEFILTLWENVSHLNLMNPWAGVLYLISLAALLYGFRLTAKVCFSLLPTPPIHLPHRFPGT